ncbi:MULTISPECIES: TIGR01777 family oxidoreductase [Myroides]|uniref:TIGR01777 family protein n=1 Tax=Myroides albus TaxID=2562892 RepID=A0A6I3LPG5_9FLAO|nr:MULTISPECIES: TIGR01777 family oxidoreductase [Myroides]MTG99220.1 TIGR01777 family protein [Myroides albus]MVX36190.1 TIGR01777 family protein [Myroides sp. LoEW2-1]UVD78678.1 TIGR01777 family oxidoreductase [Myroides albus]
MKVLVTGATGFIGKKLVSRLLDCDYQVVYLTSSKNMVSGVFMGAEGYYWDIAKQEIDRKAFEDVDVIIHLAGSNIGGSWSKKGKEQILSSRVDGSKLLMRVLSSIDHQVKHFIAASAIGIYRNGDNKQEEDNYVKATNFLGKVVNQWEVANGEIEKLGIDVTMLRTGLVLDKEEGALPKMIAPIKYHVGSVLGTGNQIYSWIHIDDLISMYMFLLENKEEGIFNAVAPKSETNKVFTNTLANVLGYKLWLPSVPSWALKLVLGQKACLVLEGQDVSCAKVVSKGFVFQFPELQEALVDLLQVAKR